MERERVLTALRLASLLEPNHCDVRMSGVYET